jgi:hypothetical protein
MTRDELLARLNSIEWNDIEFKEAAWEVPKSALSTVSAFANTAGTTDIESTLRDIGLAPVKAWVPDPAMKASATAKRTKKARDKAA